MMMKMAGAVCILLSCGMLGFIKGTEIKKRLYNLLFLQRIMLMLKSEIEYGRSELQEAFLNISERVEEPYSEWLSVLAKKLISREEGKLQVLWRESIEEYLGGIGIHSEEKKELTELGAQLGFMDKTLQTEAIHLYINCLEMHIRSAREEQAGKIKLCNCLGVMSGIFIIVILL